MNETGVIGEELRLGLHLSGGRVSLHGSGHSGVLMMLLQVRLLMLRVMLVRVPVRRPCQ